MLIPFLALQDHILTISDVQNVRVWNDNVQKLIDGEEFPYQLDCVFVEFPDEIKWDQLGNGVQIVDPLELSFHYVTSFLDAGDGTEDQNLEIFGKTNALRNTLQDWMPTTVTIPNTTPGAKNEGFYSKYAGTYGVPFGVFQRIGEMQDKSHGAIYHFIQKYLTTWVDQDRIRPVGGHTAGNLTYELDAVTAWDNTSLYTAANPVSYVTYQGGIYKCILNTTSAHESPTNTSYFTFIRNV